MRTLIVCLLLSAVLSATCLSSQVNENGPDSGDAPLARFDGEDAGFFVNERVPSIPLIVKSPYLQAWLPVGSKQPSLAGRWCEFWTGQSQGWTGFVRVDGHAYTFMGAPSLYGQSLAIQTGYKVSKRVVQTRE